MDGWLSVLGYVGYGILCLLALIWTWGVRCVLTAQVPTVLGSLTFIVAAALLPLLDASLLNAWWIIPAVYGLMLCVYTPIMAYRVPLLWPALHIIGSLHAAIVRIGISARQIDDAWDAQYRSLLRGRGASEQETEQALQRYERWKAMRINRTKCTQHDRPNDTQEVSGLLPMQWYVLRVVEGMEDEVCEALREQVFDRRLTRVVNRILAPFAAPDINTTLNHCAHKMYPGYIFLEMSMNESGRIPQEIFVLIKATNGVGDFIGYDGRPSPMNPAEAEKVLSAAIADHLSMSPSR